jgi:hypothetical protein
MTREQKRLIATELGEGPAIMFDDGLPLKFLHGPKQQNGGPLVGELTKKENDWLDQATAAAVTGARKIAASHAQIHVGQLSNHEWEMICTAVIFAWIEVRVQQAIAEGRNSEETVRQTGLRPSPCDSAVVRSILPVLADQAGFDWSQPLTAWSSDMITSFLLLAWRLIDEAAFARDHGPGLIVKKSEFNEETGDPLPFDL